MDTGIPRNFRHFRGPYRSLRGRLSQSTSLSRRLDIEALEPRILLSADLLPIHGAIDVPGEINRYSFTLKDAKQLYFDAETNNSSLNWSLDGPKGAEVVNRSFTTSDSANLGGSPLLSLAPGDYHLSVSASNDTTGAYDFRLLDAANATTITPGQPVSGTLNPANETDLYQFHASAGQQFYFDSTGLSGNDPYWRLIGPQKNVVFGPTYFGSDVGTTTLTDDGTYTLAVEGRTSNTGATSYSFNVQPAITHTVDLTVGATEAATISTPGQTDRYNFTLSAGTNLIFDSLTNSSNLTWSLDGPRGREVDSRSFANSDAERLGGNAMLALPAGSYTITVAGTADATGSYGFRLLNPSAATSIALGDTVTGTLGDAIAADVSLHPASTAPFDAGVGVTNRALQADSRNIYATVADAPALNPTSAITVEAWVYKDPSAGTWSSVLGKSTSTSWNDGYGLAIFPDGKLHFFVGTYSVGNAGADIAASTWTHVAGTWDGSTVRLYVNGVLANETAYAGPPAVTSAPLSIGNGAGGTYNWRGQIDEVRIWNTARTAAQITADAASAISGAPAGLVAAWHFDEASGNTLTDATGHGHDATIVNRPGTETRLYSLTATAGTRIYLDELSVTGSIYRRLYGPSGELLFGPEYLNDHGVYILPATGTYTLSIEGSPYNQGGQSYSFRVDQVVDDTAALTVGQTMSGSIGTPGQQDHWTFTPTAPAKLVFDSLSNLDYAWTLTGPRGTEISNQSFRNSDSADGSGQLDLIAGAYTLTVSAPNDEIGPYSFRLLDRAAAQAIAVGATISGTLDPGNATLQYAFSGKAGDHIVLRRTSSDGGNTYWRLLDPFGRVIYGPSYFDSNPSAQIVLPATGSYELLVEGRYFQAAPLAFSFLVDLQGHVAPPAPTGTAITVGATVSGTIPTVSTGADYTVTIAAPTRIYFDSLTASNGFTWAISNGPRGAETAARGFYSTDSFENSNDPAIDLAVAGTYQIHIQTDSGTTGPFSFRLLDLAAGTLITPGSDLVSGTLTPSRTTAVYTFDGANGDRLFFDQRSFTGPSTGYASIRLIDPWGRQVAGPDSIDDRSWSLAGTGRYTLLVEGRVWDANPSYSYSFVLTPIVDPASQALTVGARTTGTIASPGQQLSYTFSLASAASLYFDTLTDNDQINWTLTGPAGFSVSRNLRNADAFELGGTNPLLVAPAGTYTLTFIGNGATTGSVDFRLLDLSVNTKITPGAATSGTLTPARSTSVYTFDAASGDRFYLEINSLADPSYLVALRLVDPYGREVFGPETTQDHAWTATATGR